MVLTVPTELLQDLAKSLILRNYRLYMPLQVNFTSSDAIEWDRHIFCFWRGWRFSEVEDQDRMCSEARNIGAKTI